MNARNLINKTIILSFFALAGFLLARSLYYGSVIGVICALIAIAAWTMFLYKLSTAETERQQTEEAGKNY